MITVVNRLELEELNMESVSVFLSCLLGKCIGSQMKSLGETLIREMELEHSLKILKTNWCFGHCQEQRKDLGSYVRTVVKFHKFL